MNLSERRGYENGFRQALETLFALMPFERIDPGHFLAGPLFGAYSQAHDCILRETLRADFSGQQLDSVNLSECLRCHNGIIITSGGDEGYSEDNCPTCLGQGYLIQLHPGQKIYLPTKNPERTGNTAPTPVTVERHDPYNNRLEVTYSDGSWTAFHMTNDRVHRLLNRNTANGPNG